MMHAVIHRVVGAPGAGLLPVAGRPLVARQLQWLRTLGCLRVAIEVGSDADSLEIARWLTEDDAIGAYVSLVLTGRPLTPRQIARRAGFLEDARLLAVPADVVCGSDLATALPHAGPLGLVVQLDPPEALAALLEGGQLRIVGSADSAPRVVESAGWGLRVRSYAEALVLSMAALDGRIPSQAKDSVRTILIHAAERSPGVWASRGARIDPGAEIIPPVLLGARAIVRKGARVGPSVLLGAGVVVESGSTLTDVFARANTIVGEDQAFAHVVLAPHLIVDLATGERADVEDPLVLGSRLGAPSTELWWRALAILGLIAFSPLGALVWALFKLRGRPLTRPGHGRAGALPLALIEGATGIAPLDALVRLIDVARGRRSLVGVSAWEGSRPREGSSALFDDALSAPHGLFTIDAVLISPDADADARLRTRVWYAREKCFRTDLMLLLRCLRGRGARGRGRAQGTSAA
jgi:hypothetical protein